MLSLVTMRILFSATTPATAVTRSLVGGFDP
jgi:hypothetical protein